MASSGWLGHALRMQSPANVACGIQVLMVQSLHFFIHQSPQAGSGLRMVRVANRLSLSKAEECSNGYLEYLPVAKFQSELRCP